MLCRRQNPFKQHVRYEGDCRRETDQLAPNSRSPPRSGNPPRVALCALWAGCCDVDAGQEDKPGGLFLDRNCVVKKVMRWLCRDAA
jgi:hypothetical protein